jgi:hypothetical protein
VSDPLAISETFNETKSPSKHLSTTATTHVHPRGLLFNQRKKMRIPPHTPPLHPLDSVVTLCRSASGGVSAKPQRSSRAPTVLRKSLSVNQRLSAGVLTREVQR